MATIHDAVRAHQMQDFNTARRLASELAAAGDASAHYLLGMMTSFGEGGPSDPALAARHYRLAAEVGHPTACYSLAAMYALGRGVEQDFAQALHWYTRSAEAGDIDALFKIGLMHANGEGVARDLVQARSWWQQAAEQGQPEAMRCLGQLLAAGDGGIDKDVGTAADWLLRAHQAGDEHAFRLLGRLQPDLEAAAQAGSAAAQNALGVVFLFGRDEPHSAAPWLERAAAQDHPEGLRLLGFLYATGRGVELDEARAAALYTRAAERGDRFGQQNLAAMYADGRGGLPRDLSQAIRWYRRAANQGCDVNLRLAELLAERNRDRRDANEAVQRLMLVAVKSSPDTEYRLVAGDGSWVVEMRERGTQTVMAGLTMDELHGLPDED